MADSVRKKVVAFLEQVEDVSAFFEKDIYRDSEVLLIATSPQVCHELEKTGLPYRQIEDYSDRYEIITLGMNNFRTLESLCHEVDDLLRSRYFDVKKYGLRLTLDNIYPLKILYDALSIRIAILSNVIAREKPETIVTCVRKAPRESCNPQSLPFSYHESIYDILLGIPKLRGDITHERIGIGEPGEDTAISGAPGSILFAHLKEHVRHSACVTAILYCTRVAGIAGTLCLIPRILINHIHGRKKLFCMGYAYNWENILPELYREGYSVYHYHFGDTAPGDTSEEFFTPELEPIIRKYCTIGAIDFSEQFAERCKSFIRTSVACAMTHTGRLDSILEKLSPQAMICGTKPYFIDHLAAHVAHRKQIPVVSWQHGSHGMNYAPLMLFVETMDSNAHLFFGEGVQEVYAKDIERLAFATETIPVGSQELESLFATQTAGRREYDVLYVTTNYMENHLYIFSPSVLQDNDFWRTQKTILDAVGRLGLKTAFKLHPGRYYDHHLSEYVESKSYSCVTIIKNERSYTALLADADIVVIDFPSTTLLQALARGKTVFVLLRHLKFNTHAINLLKKCAYCSEDPAELAEMIARYCTGKPLDQQPDSKNTEFLEHYGIHKMDGRVAERAISALAAVIGGEIRTQ
ncbi:MAG: hypothetical protein APR53_03290 [Methanoculleus sp. SDB]|nr:MAG: hypothetical protein APR53_03290 [Methanoculleus sp. SDB]